MSNQEPATKASSLAANVLERLQDPLQLRIVLTVTMLVVVYAAVVLPYSSDIEATKTAIAKERHRVALAKQVEGLREDVKSFKDRLPEKTDANEWVQYVLAGVRQFPIKLVMLDSDTPKDLGPYKAIVLRIDLEAKYQDLNEFMRWLETNPRLMRIDAVKIDPTRGKGSLTASLIVLGVMG